MRIWTALSIIVILSSCSIQKEQRKCNRAANLVEKAVDLCPEIAQTDTIRDTVSTYIPEVKIDTVLLKSDTIILNKDHWRVKIIHVGDSIYVTGGTDSIYVEIPVEVPCDTIQPVKYIEANLKWWQIFLIFSGCILWGIILWMVIKVAL